MAVITGTDYSAIAHDYGDIISQLSGVGTYLYDAVYQIVLMNTYEPTLDLLDPFNNVYTANVSAYSSYVPFVPAVKAINNHVINRGGYSSINAFLTATGVTVPQAWVDLCAAAGFTISVNIVG